MARVGMNEVFGFPVVGSDLHLPTSTLRYKPRALRGLDQVKAVAGVDAGGLISATYTDAWLLPAEAT